MTLTKKEIQTALLRNKRSLISKAKQREDIQSALKKFDHSKIVVCKPGKKMKVR